ncbi:(4Fe-4S)-binding protein [Amycolatopsis vastitatis]|uniref:Ferredoxin n=1 Tax=Amycolatopsis vastitatis TaxID=1905142 RepID=A0A229T3G7_9PSEU|nr:ferredoxin [Amycolatopsis vastitatis]OXM65464.1 (4Fe-4S)-binding protein [Amycolatopsis vastitatis]
MAYVIGLPCVDVKDRACVAECPADCIYEGARSLYIHPDECMDCGGCEVVCPVGAIYYAEELPETLQEHARDNGRFFTEVLPGRDAPLGSPGGAAAVGPLNVDTRMIAALPPQSPRSLPRKRSQGGGSCCAGERQD